MVDWSRRKLLAGLGSTVTLATAGCASSNDEKPDEDEEENDKDSPEETETPDSEGEDEVEQPEGGYGSLLEYLPATENTDVPNVYAADVTSMNDVNEPFGSFASEFSLTHLEPYTDQVSTAVGLNAESGSTGSPVSVFEGEISPDGESETRQTDGGVEYDYYELSGKVAAVRDGISVVADSDQIVDSVFGAKAEEVTKFLDDREVTDVITERFADADLTLAIDVSNQNMSAILPDVGPDDIRHFAYAITVHGPDTLETRLQIELTDQELVTDEAIDGTEQWANNVQPSMGEGEATVEGSTITVREMVDLEAVRRAEEIESPQLGGTRDPNLDAEYVEVQIRAGDQTPVDELELRVNDETYDPSIWAQDQETIGEGDTIYISTDDVEPNTQVTLEHQHEYGSSASSTSILSWLQFRVSYDRETQAATVTYHDEIDLDGDELYVAVYEGGEYGIDGENVRSTQPWAGETVTTEDEATLEDVQPGQAILVGYGGDTQQDSLHSDTVAPPGSATFEYDHSTGELTATLELNEPRDAANYELRVGDEPAATQWSNQTDTVEGGETISASGLEIGDQAAVVWTPTDATVSRHWVQPPGSASFQYDYDAKELTITMELESEREAGAYEILVDREPTQTQWTDQGETVQDGDTVTLSDIDIGDSVRVVWTEGPEGEPIAYDQVRPPGDVSFTYDPETQLLTAELELEESQPADNYLLRIDGEPASVQWSDQTDTVEDGDTLAIENVTQGARVELAWDTDQAEEQKVIGGTHAEPSADLSFSTDRETGTIEVTHDGGASFSADNLVVVIPGDGGNEDRYELAEQLDGEFAEGDTVEVQVDTLPEEAYVAVVTQNRERLVGGHLVGEEDSDN